MKRTREEILEKIRKEGYYLTEYAIRHEAEDIIYQEELEEAKQSVNDKEQLQTLSAIRQAITILNRFKVTYTITYLLQTYTNKTRETELNQPITNLQNKILNSLKP